MRRGTSLDPESLRVAVTLGLGLATILVLKWWLWPGASGGMRVGLALVVAFTLGRPLTMALTRRGGVRHDRSWGEAGPSSTGRRNVRRDVSWWFGFGKGRHPSSKSDTASGEFAPRLHDDASDHESAARHPRHRAG
jgi:hypothetical protein